MNQYFTDLNNDQLDGLAKLSFDLSKAALVLVFLPISEINSSMVLSVVRMVVGLFWGLVFIYLALIILKLKKVN